MKTSLSKPSPRRLDAASAATAITTAVLKLHWTECCGVSSLLSLSLSLEIHSNDDFCSFQQAEFLTAIQECSSPGCFTSLLFTRWPLVLLPQEVRGDAARRRRTGSGGVRRRAVVSPPGAGTPAALAVCVGRRLRWRRR